MCRLRGVQRLMDDSESSLASQFSRNGELVLKSLFLECLLYVVYFQRSCDCSLVRECLPSMCRFLNSIPSTTKKQY